MIRLLIDHYDKDYDALTISSIVQKHLQSVLDCKIRCTAMASDIIKEELILEDIQLRGGLITYKNTDIFMPFSQYTLLHYLLANRGFVRTTNQICQVLWPDNSSYKRLDSLKKKISSLRSNLCPNPGKSFIDTVHGTGYVIYNIS